MKSGDILLHYGGKSWINWLICWGTKSKYHHCSVCISGKSGIVIEAAAGFVRARAVENITTSYSVYRVKEQYHYDIEDVKSFLIRRLNRKYDYVGVIWLGVLKIFHLKRKSNAFQRNKDYFCSELVYEAFAAGGLDIVPEIPSSGIVSPADLSNSFMIHYVESCKNF